MTMLISKFHRLIQSRLLWAGFLVVIIFSFVIWGTQMPKESARAQEANAEGRLNGALVPSEEFRHAYQNTYLAVNLMMGRPVPISPRIDEQLRKQTWRRLAAVQEARRLGLSVSDAEVVQTLQHTPEFQENNAFSPTRYKAFTQGMLGQMNVTEPQFEEHVREEILLQKLRAMVQQTALVEPFELRRAFSSLNDEFVLQYVVFRPADVAAGVQVSRTNAEAFFQKNPAAFTIPEKVKVQYVRFNAAEYAAEVRTNVTDKDAQAYYDEHMDDFPATNAAAVAAAAGTNAPATPAAQPFGQVKGRILERLQREAALARASEVATDFVVALTPERGEPAPKFADIAAKYKRPMQALGPFSAAETLPGIDAGAAFARAAFALNLQAEENFSDAIPGQDGVYVLTLTERIPARVPKFDEVAAQVLAAAREQALRDALAQRAQRVREAALQTLSTNGSFAGALQPFGLQPIVTPPVTVSSDFRTNEFADVLFRGALVHNQGELTELLPADENVLLACVAKRTPGSATAFDAMREQLGQTLRRQRAQWLFEDWEQYLLTRGGFEDLRAKAKTADAAEAEEPEPSSPAPAPRESTGQYQ